MPGVLDRFAIHTKHPDLPIAVTFDQQELAVRRKSGSLDNSANWNLLHRFIGFSATSQYYKLATFCARWIVVSNVRIVHHHSSDQVSVWTYPE